MKADAKTEAAILAVMNQFMESYQKRDIDGLLGVVAPDDDLFLYGTGIDEKRIGREQLKFQAQRDWSQTDALAFNLTWYKISAAGTVAWIAGDGQGVGKVGSQDFTFPMRMTAVFEQRGDRWLLAQTHISLPSAAQDEGDSVPV